IAIKPGEIAECERRKIVDSGSGRRSLQGVRNNMLGGSERGCWLRYRCLAAGLLRRIARRKSNWRSGGQQDLRSRRGLSGGKFSAGLPGFHRGKAFFQTLNAIQ